MATAAFRSTTRRTSIGDTSSSSTNHHRRSRSVSRFSHLLPEDEPPPPEPLSRGKFVNTKRGSGGGVPEISLDDLAIELFSSSGDFGRRTPETAAEERRRGRSVSRRGSHVAELRSFYDTNTYTNSSNRNGNGNGNGGSDGSSRRRRSLSVVARSRTNDSENESFQKTRSRANSRDPGTWNRQKPLVQKPAAPNQQRGLRRCSSQKDFLKSHDGYSSYSSTLTDDEGNDARCNFNRADNAMEAAYSRTKGPRGHDQNSRWFETMQEEYAHGGKDIRLEHRQVIGDNSDGLKSVDSDNKKTVSVRGYRTELKQSEKRKQELLAEILLEEERGKELKKVVGELRPNQKETVTARRPMRGRKRSNDRNRMSKQLVEDADRIIEDFISSVEETDISSFDGERSDTSSVVGGTIKPMMLHGDMEAFKSPVRYDLLPGEMDGVVLPWLKWETSNDVTPLVGSDNKQHPATPKTVLQDAMEEITAGRDQDRSVNSKSSRGSWSPEVVNSYSLDAGEISKAGEVDSCKSQLLSLVPRRSRVDIDDYLKTSTNEDLLFERWKYRERISSGGLLICTSGSSGNFFL